MGPWPRECLSASFNCMKLIVDEFIEHILTYPGPVGQGGPVQRGMTKRLMDCLSAFTSQTRDVNVSLTSIEVAGRCAV